MTIGIAAYGPGAGRAVIRALAAVEAMGRGAIGGFVSFVALPSAGGVLRHEVQRGGTAALFEAGLSGMPAAAADAPVAGLMSSGPDRPEPLSQFTPALGGVGLVTGHRMPNTIGASGVNVNDEVLDLMRLGATPQDAVERVISANPTVDAGMIALSRNGALWAADTPHVGKRGDAGRAVLRAPKGDSVVAVLHNAIHPFRPVAALAAEVAMDEMLRSERPDRWIRFARGVGLSVGATNAVAIGENGEVRAIIVDDRKFLTGRWSLGIGYETDVVHDGRTVATMLYEPYMVIEDGRLSLIDGKTSLSVPIG